MKKVVNQLAATILTFVIALTQFAVLPALPTFAAEGDPVLEMAITNKIDVALAVGPTSVNYSTFEADLRKALKYEADGVTLRSHPVPDEDVYIMASQAVSASTTSEFSWWEYDHTRGTARYNNATNRQVSPIISDEDHIYVENDTSASQTGTSPGRPQDTDPTQLTNTDSGSTYTPPREAYSDNPTDLMKNPDVDVLTGSVHPYQGNYRHMIESNSGATMDFYGYGVNSYKDFRYLPNEQKTIKTFEFAIAEDLAYDALDGVGFFFNLDIQGSYESNTQTMSGYLLFLEYNTSGLGNAFRLYKLQNVNTKTLHHTSTNALISAIPGVTLVAQSMTYAPAHYSRRIKIEAAPDKVSVWYVGNTAKNDAVTLNTPISDYETPVDPIIWTIQAGGVLTGQPNGSLTQSVRLDTALISSYGFGPMSSYRNHGCARPTHLALQNLTMTYEKVKTLTEVVREPEWNENTYKYLVNLNEQTIQDFEENFIIAELLARLTTDDIYYIGWGSTENAIASAAFLRKHSLKGTILDIEDTDILFASAEWLALDPVTRELYLHYIQEELTYASQIQAIADEIHRRYWSTSDDNRALVTDNVIMSVTGADMQNTQDVLWPDGKWMIRHIIDEPVVTSDDGDGGYTYMTNFTGIYPYSGQYMPDLEESYNFTMPGLYEIYYREVKAGFLYVHRAPVANFIVTCDAEGYTTVVNTSYDPDVYEPGGVNGTETGIKSSSFHWIDFDDEDMLEPEPGLPEQLLAGHDYDITLTVEDYWGVTNAITRLITLATSEGEILPPFADFALSPVLLLQGVGSPVITLTNKSYDPAGLEISSVWTVYKDDILYTELEIAESDFLENIAVIPVETLTTGHYKVVLVVTNDGGVDSASVAKFFDVVADTDPPAATVLPSAPITFTGNTNLQLTFSDTGGSGFKEGRFAVVAVGVGETAPPAPAPGSADWKTLLPSLTRNVLLNLVGDNYVFWEAGDNAGNYASGVFGPYEMTKKHLSGIGMTLTAAPEDGSRAVYNSPGHGVALTATLNLADLDAEDPLPTGTVIFYQGAVIQTVLGYGTVNSSGVATLTYNAVPNVVSGDTDFHAEYMGDANYDEWRWAQANLIVYQNPDAEVIIGAQDDKTYDGDAYTPAISDPVSPPAAGYKVEYVGRDGTTYGPTDEAPSDAGKYTVIVTTTNDNYEEKSASADFEILPWEMVLTLTPDGDTEALGTVTLTATVAHAKELPPGSLEFYIDGILLATVDNSEFYEYNYDGSSYTYTAEADWSDMIAGDYTLTLKYIPYEPDNYTAHDFVIEHYNIEKLDQTISFTSPSPAPSPIDKTYGDTRFYVEATGGLSSPDVVYSRVRGASVIDVDPDTGEITITGAGTAVVRATKPGDESYNQATADITINVGKKAGSFEIVLDDPVFGDTFAPEVVTNEGRGAVAYVYEGINGTEYDPSDEPPTAVGEYRVTATAAETTNYLSASASAEFAIAPCECEVTGIDFDGAAIYIPYFSVQNTCDLIAVAAFDSCGRSGHNYSITYDYKIISSLPAGSAVIDQAAGQLIVNDKAAGYEITIEVTATHTPTGHTGVGSAVFTVIKDKKPDDPASEPGADGSYGPGNIDKNKEDYNENPTVALDVSSIYPPGTTDTPTVVYGNGPDGNEEMIGAPLEEWVDYELYDGLVVFTEEFIASLYAGDHDISFEVNGFELVFHLYIAPGDLFVGVSFDNSADPPIPAVKNDIGELKDDLKESEEKNPENRNDVDKGYDVYIDLVVSQAGVTQEGKTESALIETSAGKKQISRPFIDIALIKTMRGVPKNIKDAEEPIRLIIEIPESIRGMRNYIVARVHTPAVGQPEFELLPTTLSSDGTQLFFSSDKFSTFAILYDKKIVDDRPYDEDSGSANASGGSSAGLAATPVLNPPDGAADPDDDPAGSASDGQNGFAGVSDGIRGVLETGDHIAYINGYNDGTVRPDGAITRAEVAAIFFRLLINPSKNDAATGSFTDVPSGSWYARQVNYLAQAGILDGYKDGSFKPNQNITRAEFAAIASRFDHYGGDMDNPFVDVTSNHWAYESILSAYSMGWVNGYTDGEFRPQTNITRGEVVVIVNRILGRRLAQEDVPEELYSFYSDLTANHWAFSDIIEASVAHEYETKANGYEIWIGSVISDR